MVHDRLAALQDALLDVLGSSSDRRADLVEEALRRDAHEVAAYWLKLVVAIGIATLGLVVGSTAVIIGAMLVAPLMGPIVDLALGLGAGSPVLVIRSALRIAGSVVVTIGGSAAITWLLPFHVTTSEITSRTAPNALDLVIAAFCAIAGVFASLRPKSDTVSTAAGTSIGISLVPPLCTAGFGLGVADPRISAGATMLFLANFAAIVVVGTLVYLLTGFDRVDVGPVEQSELERGHDLNLVRVLALRLSRFFASRFGHPARLVMPLAFLATIYVPLRRALDQVAWEVRVRIAIDDALARAPGPVLQRHVRIDGRDIDVRVVLAGAPNSANPFEESLGQAVKAASGEVAHVDVIAVPEAGAFEALAARLSRAEDVGTAHASGLVASAHRHELLEAVRASWPAEALGDLLRVRLDMEDPAALHVVYLGEPAGDAVRAILRRSLEQRLGRALDVRTYAVVAAPRDVSRLFDEPGTLVRDLTRDATLLEGIDEVYVCERRPPRPAATQVGARHAAVAAWLDATLGGRERRQVTEGPDWSVRFSRTPCGGP
jgi:uncharacterized hydrophobic protein (TIGR00271 family)